MSFSVVARIQIASRCIQTWTVARIVSLFTQCSSVRCVQGDEETCVLKTPQVMTKIVAGHGYYSPLAFRLHCCLMEALSEHLDSWRLLLYFLLGFQGHMCVAVVVDTPSLQSRLSMYWHKSYSPSHFYFSEPMAVGIYSIRMNRRPYSCKLVRSKSFAVDRRNRQQIIGECRLKSIHLVLSSILWRLPLDRLRRDDMVILYGDTVLRRCFCEIGNILSSTSRR
jgi:hypothetical protein